MIEKLLSEGFSLSTVNSLSDNHLILLSKRLFENDKGSVKVKKETDPMLIKKITDNGTNVELVEKEVEDEKLKEETKKWISGLVNEKLNITTKGEIMEMLTKTIVPEVKPKIKQPHPLTPDRDIKTKPKAKK